MQHAIQIHTQRYAEEAAALVEARQAKYPERRAEAFNSFKRMQQLLCEKDPEHPPVKPRSYPRHRNYAERARGKSFFINNQQE